MLSSNPSAQQTTHSLLPAPFDWIEIPNGKGTLKTDESNVTLTIPTERYWISKYLVTNAQYDMFVNASDGYKNAKWWDYSQGVANWRKNCLLPQPTGFAGDDLPRTNVSWYESVAFCLWLSETTGEKIMLPTEDQWQYVAQGDDSRSYPWGNQWDASRCNNNVDSKGIGKTTPARHYEGRCDSPFGVVDMAGNVWEWCLTDYHNKTNDMNHYAMERVLRGGSWDFDHSDYFRCDYRNWEVPSFSLNTIGFRLARSNLGS